MQDSCKAFVLKTVKYGDSSLIINAYSDGYGKKSFLIKSFFSKKKKLHAIRFPLSEIEIQFYNQSRSNLGLVRSIQFSSHYKTNHSNHFKSSILLFLAEVLSSCIQEEESNPNLFFFIQNSLNQLDQTTKDYSDFHLHFLINLTNLLGIYPNIENSNLSYFDLEQSNFVKEKPGNKYFLEGMRLELFRNLFLEGIQKKNKKREKLESLDILLDYFQLHLGNFKKPKSLQILKEIF